MAKRSELKINSAALRSILKSQEADAAVLRMASEACRQANDWAARYPRSGRHKDTAGPHFEVVEEPGRNRARYTIRPCTGFGTWLAQTYPAQFMACLNAARG